MRNAHIIITRENSCRNNTAARTNCFTIYICRKESSHKHFSTIRIIPGSNNRQLHSDNKILGTLLLPTQQCSSETLVTSFETLRACSGAAPPTSWRFCLEIFFMLFMLLTNPVCRKPNAATFLFTYLISRTSLPSPTNPAQCARKELPFSVKFVNYLPRRCSLKHHLKRPLAIHV